MLYSISINQQQRSKKNLDATLSNLWKCAQSLQQGHFIDFFLLFLNKSHNLLTSLPFTLILLLFNISINGPE